MERSDHNNETMAQKPRRERKGTVGHRDLKVILSRGDQGATAAGELLQNQSPNDVPFKNIRGKLIHSVLSLLHLQEWLTVVTAVVIKLCVCFD